jgi:hypothetical protein
MDTMDKKQMNNPQLAREHAVYGYLESLENGDIDGIIQSLQRAVYDATLDQMLIEAHQAYFQEGQQEEQLQSGILVSIPARADQPTPRSFSSRTRPEQRRRRGFPVWARVLVAVLVAGVLIGSFAALLRSRPTVRSGTPSPVPASSACTALKPYPAPDHGNMSDLLNAVTVVAPQDVWAVGYAVVAQYSLMPERTLIEHWNGQRWQIVASPNGKAGNAGSTNGMTDNGILKAVAAASKNDIWAVGWYQARIGGTGDENYNPLIEHWNGSNWQIIPAPTSPASRGPNSPSGNGKLSALSVVSPNDIWAAGEAVMPGGETYLPLLEHWDGEQWSVVSSFPRTGSIKLNGLAAVSARNIWVAGENFPSPTTTQGLLAQWDGSRWKLFPFPDVFSFEYLSASAPDDIWAIDTPLAAPSTSQIQHWDGRKWSTMPLPQLSSEGTYYASLFGITAVTARNVWAVGTLRLKDDMTEQFLVLHWNGKTWQRVKAQVPRPQANNNARAIAIGNNQIWIVGDQEGHTALIQGCA